MDHEILDVVVIGGGAVGTAVALKLSKSFESVALLEKNSALGLETTSRNSEVIHAGIYYPRGTLKSILCVKGKSLLYDFCEKFDVDHRRIGKLIVARDEEEFGELEKIITHAALCGVNDLVLLTSNEVYKLEPLIKSVGAIFSPSTGIISAHELVAAMKREAEKNNVMIAFLSQVTGITRTPKGYSLEIQGKDCVEARRVVNCAGLWADHVAALAGFNVEALGYRQYPCKGEYYSLQKKIPVNHLVYPVPLRHLTGLGIHITLGLDGRVKFGPNAYYVHDIDYQQDARYHGEFYRSACDLIPGIAPEEIVPDQTGIRPKLQGPGEPFRDFIISEESNRGYPGWINCIGIESPGLTASLAIAEYVAGLAETEKTASFGV